MEKGEHLKRQNRPSMLQLRYMRELHDTKKKRGIQRVIAERCGVNASTINRYFKICIEKGILSEELEFTSRGEEWFGMYWEMYQALMDYLTEVGAREDERQKAAEAMIENTDIHILQLMLNDHQKQKYRRMKEVTVQSEMSVTFRDEARCQVEFAVYKMSRKVHKNRFSMAMHGFEEEAWIVQRSTGRYLELTLKDMAANSRINGTAMSGYLNSLKYEENDQLVAAEISGNKLYIPMSAFKMHRWPGGEQIASISITVTGSVGRMHMPESTALLCVWF